MSDTRFWVLRKIMTHKYARRRAEWAEGEMITEKKECSINPDHLRTGKRITDLSIVLSNHKVDDIVWTWYSECLFQDHVLDKFRKERLTGFEVKPVKCRFKDDEINTPPRLWEVVITGWAGIAKPESGIRLDKCCDSCGLLHYSGLEQPEKLINDSEWDGSDLFMVWPLPRYVFLSERAANVIREAHFKGATIQPLDVLTRNNSRVIPGYSPGRLSYYMPIKRAMELGSELGIT